MYPGIEWFLHVVLELAGYPSVRLFFCSSACLTVFLSICLPVCLFACLSVCLSACQFDNLSVCLFVRLPTCPPVSVCLFAYLSVWPPACQFVCLPGRPSPCSSFCLPVRPSVCLFLFLSVFSSVCLFFLSFVSPQPLTLLVYFNLYMYTVRWSYFVSILLRSSSFRGRQLWPSRDLDLVTPPGPRGKSMALGFSWGWASFSLYHAFRQLKTWANDPILN